MAVRHGTYQLRLLDDEIPALAGATGINTSRQVVGRLDSGVGIVYSVEESKVVRAFQTTTSGRYQRARINNAEIVGHTILQRNNDYAARYDTITDNNEFLTTTRPSQSRDINDGAHICGFLNATVNHKPGTGFIYLPTDPTQQFWSLNDLVNPDPIWLTGDFWIYDCVPNAITNSLTPGGTPFIVGTKQSEAYTYRGRGFVLVPVEP